MLTIQGFYDGAAIRTLEKIKAKPNQRVVITIMDEFIEPPVTEVKKSMRGVISDYADPKLAEKEKTAWEHAAAEKYGNT